MSSHTFVVLLDGVSVFGLNGLDQLYCFMIVREMKNFFKRFEVISLLFLFSQVKSETRSKGPCQSSIGHARLASPNFCNIRQAQIRASIPWPKKSLAILARLLFTFSMYDFLQRSYAYVDRYNLFAGTWQAH